MTTSWITRLMRTRVMPRATISLMRLTCRSPMKTWRSLMMMRKHRGTERCSKSSKKEWKRRTSAAQDLPGTSQDSDFIKECIADNMSHRSIIV